MPVSCSPVLLSRRRFFISSFFSCAFLSSLFLFCCSCFQPPLCLSKCKHEEDDSASSSRSFAWLLAWVAVRVTVSPDGVAKKRPAEVSFTYLLFFAPSPPLYLQFPSFSQNPWLLSLVINFVASFHFLALFFSRRFKRERQSFSTREVQLGQRNKR